MGELLTVNEAAAKFGFSTKYIYALIQAGELKSIKKHGRTFIDIDDLAEVSSRPAAPDQAAPQKPSEQKAEPRHENNALLEYLYEVVADQKQQIAQLQEKLEQCQNESVNTIKEANAKKDEQLQQYMAFLNNSTRDLIATALEQHVGQTPEIVVDEESVEAEIKEESIKVLLNNYLVDKGYSKKERKKIYTRCQNAFLEDSTRFHVHNRKLYIYPNEYRYDDLL